MTLKPLKNHVLAFLHTSLDALYALAVGYIGYKIGTAYTNNLPLTAWDGAQIALLVAGLSLRYCSTWYEVAEEGETEEES